MANYPKDYKANIVRKTKNSVQSHSVLSANILTGFPAQDKLFVVLKLRCMAAGRLPELQIVARMCSCDDPRSHRSTSLLASSTKKK